MSADGREEEARAEPGDGGRGAAAVPPGEQSWCTGENARWYVRIDNFHPHRLNELLHVHWAERNRRKKYDEQVIGIAVRGANVPKAELKRTVGLEITLAPRQRTGDPDAYWKSTLDALVKCGALVNDSPNWVRLLPVKFKRGKSKATVIFLQECYR